MYLEEYYVEPDLIKKPEVEEYHELSDDKISDEFVPVEDGKETQLRLGSQTMTTKQIQLLRQMNGTMTTEYATVVKKLQ